MNIKLLQFRLQFRKQISQATYEMIKIMREELQKEQERRNKK